MYIYIYICNTITYVYIYMNLYMCDLRTYLCLGGTMEVDFQQTWFSKMSHWAPVLLFS